MKISVIETGRFKLDGGAMFGIVPKPLWNQTNPADEQNRIDLAMRALAIEDGNRLVLIDNGLGDKYNEKFKRNYAINHEENTLEKSLASAGYSFQDVTDVVLTHLHFDHAGGSTQRRSDGLFEPTFPSATYWIQEKQWETANHPNTREKASFFTENFEPLKSSGQLSFMQESLFPWMDIYVVHGHSEGMQLPFIRYKEYQILYCADLFPTAGHIPLPYVMAYDMQPLLTLQEREYWLPRLAQEPIILFFEHDPNHAMATITQKDGKYKAHEMIVPNAIFS